MKNTKALEPAATGPLAGVRILDLTSVVFGAYATQMLADQGAEVIKVESPTGDRGGGGDITRWNGATPEGAPADLGPMFMTINRNKRSVLLDLREKRALDVVRRLAARADVFVSSVRYAGLQRLGLDYEAVRAERPDIVYVHGCGYGSDGPRRGEPAYDDLIQAASGIADLLPRAGDDARLRYLPTLIGDKVAGLFMAQAVTAALLHRERTGEGQFVEVPMLECMTSFNLAEHFFGHVYDPPTGPWAYSRIANPNRKPFRTRDGYIALMPLSDQQWETFFAAAGMAEALKADPRFADYKVRAQHIRELYGLVEQVTVTKTTAEWIAILKPRSVPVGVVNRLDDLQDDEHLKAVGFFERYEHPQAGAYYSVKPPVRFSKTPSNIRRHAPRLGEHTDEVLAEIEAEG